ncbi:MAG: rRNA maturation RNase YbeY [Candidatus Altimarinota bacterium]
MKIELEFKMSEQESGLFGGDFKALADETLRVLEESKSLGVSENFYKVEKGIVEVGFLEDEKMCELNKKYRHKDETTDVLSFSFLEGEKFPGDDLIGQIYISLKVARKQAEENGWSLEEEVKFLFVHGLLHVFGFDHLNKKDFEEMFKWHAEIQPEVLDTIRKIKEGTDWLK